MFLSRLIEKIKSLLFPGYADKKAQKEKAEILFLEQQILPTADIKAAFPHLKVWQKKGSGRWVVQANHKTDAYLALNFLLHTGQANTKCKAGRILTSVRIDKKSSLTLTEYLYPVRIKPRLDGRGEVLFANIAILSGGQAKKVIDFYIDNTSFNKKDNYKTTIF